MWFAWDMESLIVHSDDKLNDTIVYRTKAEAMWDISCRYEDGRKRPTVKKMDVGYYIYYPKDCDGNWRDETTIASVQYLKNNEFLRKEFKEYLVDLLKKVTEEKEEFDGDLDRIKKAEQYYNDLVNLKKELETIEVKING
nr:MAG TPA: hypothetical protein [Caudoviricetes sp.]